MTIEYVNINGDPMTLNRDAKIKASKKSTESFHKGWRVVGYSPEQVLQARNDHAHEVAGAAAAGKPTPPPFNPDTFMRKTKPRKVRSAPYPLREAAEQCREMALKAGWLHVRLEAYAKGDK